MTNVETLTQAGLVHTSAPLTNDEAASVNALSPAEIEALISIKAKLGDDFFKRQVATPDGQRLGTVLL
ncbi:MAG: hypothetical protein WBY53_20365 [Acidobacteriaceae bacterium]